MAAAQLAAVRVGPGQHRELVVRRPRLQARAGGRGAVEVVRSVLAEPEPDVPVPDGVARRRLGRRASTRCEPAGGADADRALHVATEPAPRQLAVEQQAESSHPVDDRAILEPRRVVAHQCGELGEERPPVHLLDLGDGRCAGDRRLGARGRRGPVGERMQLIGVLDGVGLDASAVPVHLRHAGDPDDPGRRTDEQRVRRERAPAPGRARDDVGAAPGPGRARPDRGEHVRPEVDQRERVEAAVRLAARRGRRAPRPGRARRSSAAHPSVPRPDARMSASGSARACTNRFGGAHMRVGSGSRVAVMRALMRLLSTSGYPNTTPSAATAAASVALTVRDRVMDRAADDGRRGARHGHRQMWVKRRESVLVLGVLADPRRAGARPCPASLGIEMLAS